MSLLLCHQCYSWEEPRGGRCPECHQIVDVETPDPPVAALEHVIGQICHRIGEVRVKRKMLPDRGMLYATTNGLFFLPHRLATVTRMIEHQAEDSSLVWTLAAAIWWPVAVAMPFVRTKRLELTDVAVLRPQFLNATDSHQLPVFLMENPGVFFVPKQIIRTVACRRGNWRVERWHASTLKFTPAANRRRFDDRMRDLFASASWQDIYVKS